MPEGGPLFLRGATQNPYSGLEQVMLGTHPTENVRGIAGKTKEALNRLFSRLVVTNLQQGQRLDEETIRMTLQHLNVRYVFVVDEEGTALGAAFGGAEDLHTASMSTFTPQFAQDLEIKRARAAPLRLQHLTDLQTFMGEIAGGTVVEMGAADDHERINFLQRYAAGQNTDFLCHDLTPAAARNGAARRPNIPYLAIPPDPFAMAQSLSTARHPHVWTLQNVLTVLGFGSSVDFFVAARDAGVDRLVATHSLSLPVNSGVFVPGWETIEGTNPHSPLHQAIGQRLVEEFAERTGGDILELEPELREYMVNHVVHLYRLLCTEVYKDDLCRQASAAGFPHVDCLVVKRHMQMDRKKLQKLHQGGLDPRMNSLAVTPFADPMQAGVTLGKNQGRLHTLEWHLIASNTPLPRSHDALRGNCNVSRHVRSYLVDQEWRSGAISPWMLAQSPDNIRRWAPQLPTLQLCANQAALKIVFENLPQEHIRRYAGGDLHAFLKQEYSKVIR